MISFFKTTTGSVIAVQTEQTALSKDDVKALCWLFGEAEAINQDKVEGFFVGPRDGYPLEHQCRGDNPEHGPQGHTPH